MSTRNGTRVVAYSISMCIADMLRHGMPSDVVDAVEAGTDMLTPQSVEQVIVSYRQNFWATSPDEGERIFRDWLRRGLITQPRQYGSRYSLSNGIWQIGGRFYQTLPPNWQEL